MSKQFLGFNSINWQKMELILNEKHCTWLGNIFAYPGVKGIGEGLGGIWEAMYQRKLGFLCNCRDQGFRAGNSEGGLLAGKSRENAHGQGWVERNLWLEGKGIAINHLYVAKIQIKSNNIERKRRESNPAKEKSGSEKQGVTFTPTRNNVTDNSFS